MARQILIKTWTFIHSVHTPNMGIPIGCIAPFLCLPSIVYTLPVSTSTFLSKQEDFACFFGFTSFSTSFLCMTVSNSLSDFYNIQITATFVFDMSAFRWKDEDLCCYFNKF